jgi:hypothetical protein
LGSEWESKPGFEFRVELGFEFDYDEIIDSDDGEETGHCRNEEPHERSSFDESGSVEGQGAGGI